MDDERVRGKVRERERSWSWSVGECLGLRTSATLKSEDWVTRLIQYLAYCTGSNSKDASLRFIEGETIQRISLQMHDVMLRPRCLARYPYFGSVAPDTCGIEHNVDSEEISANHALVCFGCYLTCTIIFCFGKRKYFWILTGQKIISKQNIFWVLF